MNKLSDYFYYLKIKLSPYIYHFKSEPKPEKWVFIIGCYNSGTTLLNQILALHPQIGSMPKEGQEYTDELPKPKDFGIPRLWAAKPELFYLDENSATKINTGKIKRQWGLFYNDANRPVLIEKTITNCARMRWLNKNFKNSYFICIVRNGYAVAEGIKRKAKYPVEKGIYQWKYANEIMLRDMEHVENKILISYENLSTDTIETLNRICKFLSVPGFDNSVLEKKFNVLKVNSKIVNMNDSSIANLSADEINTINSMAAPLLNQFGYEVIGAKSEV